MLDITGYDFHEQLYKSTNSTVYRGTRIADRKAIILKILNTDTPEDIIRFSNEYTFTKDIDIKGVRKVYESLQIDNKYALILEYVEGDTLRKTYIENRHGLTDFLSMAIQITQVLGEVHKHDIIHKDINPNNILVDVETSHINIIDFGIASKISLKKPHIGNPDSLEGTLAYISPEQTGRMNRVVDYRTDLYSLGVTFYEILTGKPPFEFKDLMELVHAHVAKIPTPPHEVVGQTFLIDPKTDLPSLTNVTVRMSALRLVSNIIMTLMEKNAEDRYQSATGLEYDLERIFELIAGQVTRAVELSSTLDKFELAQHDFSGKFQLPQKLYGRDDDIKLLLATFDRVSQEQKQKFSFCSELLLVAGHSGVGKSILVSEIYKAVTVRRGHFIQGKFDQFLRNIPYSAFVQAFNEFINIILTKNPDELKAWKTKLRKAAGNIGKVLTNLVPNLELIIGEQPDIPELGGIESQNRFHYAFRNFIKAISTPENPLVIFLDDWQWADIPSINMLKNFTTDKDIKHLLVIGTYRDNEVSPSNPFTLGIETIKEEGGIVHTIHLQNLTTNNIMELVADSLGSRSLREVEELSNLVYEKTQGNAFFAGQFLQKLYEDELLMFDFSQNKWIWDVPQIEAQNLTDNVIELMANNIDQLSQQTIICLQFAACIGNTFNAQILAIVSKQDVTTTVNHLLESIEEGLIIPLDDYYKATFTIPQSVFKFVHNRVQQAAYFLISEDRRQPIHLEIGRLLLAHTPKDELTDAIFDIANQYNAGVLLIESESEKIELAKLNLAAGLKAKESSSYQPAFGYLQVGIALLAEDSWHTYYDLTLSLYTESAETAFLSGDFEQAETLSEIVLNHAKSVLDKVRAYIVKIQAYVAQTNPQGAIETGLEVLRLLGVTFPKSPNQRHVLLGFAGTGLAFKGKQISDLVNLPGMNDPYIKSAMQIMSYLATSSYVAIPELFVLISLKLINLTLNHGNAPESVLGYSTCAILLCGVLGYIDTGYKIGELSLDLLEKLSVQESKTKTLLVIYLCVKHWKNHLKETLTPFLEAYRLALETGALEDAALATLFHAYTSYFVGKKLTEVEPIMRLSCDIIAKLKQESYLSNIRLYWQVTLNLMNCHENPYQIVGTSYDEQAMLLVYNETNNRTSIFYLYINKLILCYLFEVYQQALESAILTEKDLKAGTGMPMIPIFYFYDSLVRLALYPTLTRLEQWQYHRKIRSNQKRMKKWAKHAPMNYLHKYYLVEAEMCRVLEKNGLAREYYDKAITLAKIHEYINEEALAYELAGKFYLAEGQPYFAEHYLYHAHDAYRQWGAAAKVKHLEEKYPQLLMKHQDATSTMPIGLTMSRSHTTAQYLDISSIIKASQILSGEIVLAKLLEKMMNIVIENAGADRGFLLLSQNDDWFVEAEVYVDQTDVKVLQSIPVGENDYIANMIVNYVSRTQENVVLHNASQQGHYTQDIAILKHNSRSVLCMPLINQGKLSGILYLENTLSDGAFTPDRLELLNLLSSQISISIENAKLYKESVKLAGIQRELSLAKEIQENLLPPAKPDWADIDVVCYGVPAREVGGDLYVYYTFSSSSYCIALGDITGKGMPAALLMAVTLSSFRVIVKQELSPKELMMKLDGALYDYTQNTGQNCAMIYVELDLTGFQNPSGLATATFVNTGCTMPLIKRNDGSVEWVKIGGAPLGVGLGYQFGYTESTRNLAKGDMIILSSDGLVEAMNSDNEMFGFDQFEEIVRIGPLISAEVMVEYLKEKVAQFVGDEEPHDDLTIVVIKV